MKSIRGLGFKVFETIKNAFGIAKDEIIGIFTLFFTIWEVCGVVSGAKDLRQLVFGGLIAAIAICLLFFLWGLRKAISGNISIKICDKTVTLLRNDYEINLNNLLHSMPSTEQAKTIFVIGLDQSGSLAKSTRKGILSSVLALLDSSFICNNGNLPSTEIQQQIDGKLLEKNTGAADNNAPFSMGDCIEINLVLKEISKKKISKKSDERFLCNLLLVANSKKIFPDDEKQIEKVTDENETYLIIPQILDYLNGSGYSYAMIGIMGSNGLSQPYQVIFSQIINQFARVCIKNNDSDDLKRLYISIREKDYLRWNVSLSQLESFVQACSKFYNKKDS